jgi:hypothetical protein
LALALALALALPLYRSANTPTLRETVDLRPRQQLTCLRPGTQLIMSRAMSCTSLMLRTT